MDRNLLVVIVLLVLLSSLAWFGNCQGSTDIVPCRIDTTSTTSLYRGISQRGQHHQLIQFEFVIKM